VGYSERYGEGGGGINNITGQIINAALRIHSKLGPGLLKSVYERVLARDLARLGYRVGLLLNFGAPLMKDGIARVVNGL